MIAASIDYLSLKEREGKKEKKKASMLPEVAFLQSQKGVSGAVSVAKCCWEYALGSHPTQSCV